MKKSRYLLTLYIFHCKEQNNARYSDQLHFWWARTTQDVHIEIYSGKKLGRFSAIVHQSTAYSQKRQTDFPLQSF